MTKAVQRLLSALPLPAGYQLVRSGCYHYLLNGKATDIIEPWLQAQDNAGKMQTLSARFVDSQGLAILVRHQTTSDAAIGQLASTDFDCELSWQQAGQPDIVARYQYTRHTSRLCWTVSPSLDSTEHRQLRPEQWLFFPLMRVFSGSVINSLASLGPMPTLVPDINNISQRTTIFQPSESLRSAKKLGEDCITVAGKQYQCSRYAYLSERYQQQDDAAFWLNEQSLLCQYVWQQNPDQHWQIELHDEQIYHPTQALK